MYTIATTKAYLIKPCIDMNKTSVYSVAEKNIAWSVDFKEVYWHHFHTCDTILPQSWNSMCDKNEQ